MATRIFLLVKEVFVMSCHAELVSASHKKGGF